MAQEILGVAGAALGEIAPQTDAQASRGTVERRASSGSGLSSPGNSASGMSLSRQVSTRRSTPYGQ